MPRALAHALLATVALVLAGCASAPYAPGPATPYRADQPFAIDGRLSARRGSDAVAVSFVWDHAPPKDEFVVTTPLGGAIAEMSGDASTRRVEVRTADGRTDTATDWTTLTERIVGFPLPVDGLAFWAQGAARPDTPQTAEVDAGGRLRVLRQDGCEIVYTYAEGSSSLPAQLRLTCHDLELRVVIDRRRGT